MRNPIQQAIESRISTNRYQPGRRLPATIVASLVDQATRAPSAYNFQNWRFIAVQSPEAKARLQEAAWGQQQIADASVTFIICGTLAAHERLAESLEPAVQAGIMDRQIAAGWLAQAQRAHTDNHQLQRDEAIRSASLAAMTLMLAAHGHGLASGAIGGFEAERVTQEFGLAANEVPVLLVAVGYPAEGNWPQKPRRPVEEVLAVV